MALSPTPPNPLATKIPEISIKKIDVQRVERDYHSCRKQENPEQEKPPSLPNLTTLIEHIVQKYNRKHIKKNEDESVSDETQDSCFRKITLPSNTWKKKERNGFDLLIYYCFCKVFNPISSMLEKLEANVQHPRGISYLFFLFRVKQKVQEIFALSSGNQGYLPVQPFSDYTFPRKIIYRLLNPKEKPKTSSNDLTGPVISSTQILRNQTSFDPLNLSKIYTTYRSVLRKNASLYQFACFRRKKGTDPFKKVEMSLKVGGIRIHQSLAFETYPPILDHFSTISRDQPTYLYQIPNPERRKREEDQKEDFDFLEYYTQVSIARSAALDRSLQTQLVSNCTN